MQVERINFYTNEIPQEDQVNPSLLALLVQKYRY